LHVARSSLGCRCLFITMGLGFRGWGSQQLVPTPCPLQNVTLRHTLQTDPPPAGRWAPSLRPQPRVMHPLPLPAGQQ
jgi:hypothetical protein